MTPPTDPENPLDGDRELTGGEVAVHAVLDGEATAEQRRRVARDPHLVALLAELRAVADAVATVPPALPAATFDRIRTAALDAPARTGRDGGPLLDEAAPPEAGPPPIDDDATSRGGGDGREGVVALAPRRKRRSLPPLPAVAAVVVLLLAVGVGLIVSGQGDRAEQTTAASRDDAADDGTRGDADSGGSGSESGAEDAPESGALSAPGEVSATFPDDATLRMALEQTDPATLDLASPDVSGEAAGPESAATEPDDRGASEDSARPSDEGRALAAGPEATRCSAALEASKPSIAPAVAAALVAVDGQQRLVLTNPVSAREGTPAATQITVFESESCVPLFAVRRDP